MPNRVVNIVFSGAINGKLYTVENDCALIAVLNGNVPQKFGVQYSDQVGSVCISADPNVRFSDLSAPTLENLSIISMGGILPFPIQLSQGERLYISTGDGANIQLWLTD